ncbi:helix-turn-helix transcriptional regulator [Actinomadura sp. DC4]|uniref:helix-turn-helix domain-containing protein n=1 Tax=Actinomadura sp. DC4 TaxID=3055069 RepID=UPI0025B2180F|nr:helix-turn-helix transcriptional regulator [Actinomadura sp. DC4]MDN3351804.1 helix-turn-helix transcriptional regulator [Actinomadura sp. DC4]
MSPSAEIRIGERLRFYRQGRGKTQAAVAGLAGVTEDYLSQIERGLKTPTITLLHQFARILGVRVSVLLGEPEFEQDGTAHPVASEIHRAMMAYGGADSPVELAPLRGRVDAAWNVWQCSPNRYTEGAAILPELISDVQQAGRAFHAVGEAAERRDAARLTSDMYFLLRTFAKRIGRTDLSLLAADRGIAAAQDADDPLRMAAATWNLGHILLAQGEAEAAEETALRAAEELKPRLDDGPDWVALYGSLWLVAVVASVRQGDSWTARDRLREYALPAAKAAGEGNVLWTVFGPTNVDLHAMSVEMESGEAATGLAIADQIDVTNSPSLERQTTFYLELARLNDQRRDDAAVLLHLISAEASGPEDMRYNLLARDLVRGLLRRARPSLAPQVRALAKRIGLVTP